MIKARQQVTTVKVDGAAPEDAAALQKFQQSLEALSGALSRLLVVRRKNNGVVLFIFRDDRKMRIEVGYGLEGALPDATAKRILDTVFRPAFQQRDFDGGVTRAVDTILAATHGEYQAPAERDAIEHADDFIPLGMLLLFGMILVGVPTNAVRGLRGNYYGPRRRRTVWAPSGWSFRKPEQRERFEQFGRRKFRQLQRRRRSERKAVWSLPSRPRNAGPPAKSWYLSRDAG